jgi:hypothetical protein
MEAILLLLTGPLLALTRLSGEGALLSTHDWRPHVSVTSVGAPSGGPPTFAPSCALAAWPRCQVDASRSGETRAVAARSDWSARQPRTGPGVAVHQHSRLVVARAKTGGPGHCLSDGIRVYGAIQRLTS